MAVYKVPQDVEAEDKLLGPLSFRQFIYLMIAGAAIAVGFFLFQAFWLLAIIPVPIVVFFGVLALPLRKDQPMETYLLAVVRFYLKPRQRMWDPDGTISYVEITAPKLVEERLAKEFSGDTARERLDYLARVMDSRGWALKNVEKPSENVNVAVANEAAQAVDVLDETNELSKSLQGLLARNEEGHMQQLKQAMQSGQPRPATISPQNNVFTQQFATSADDENIATPDYNPYPASMHQKVVHPLGEVNEKPKQASKKPATEVKKPTTSAMTPQVSPDIMRLASNDDLSVETLAREAHRLQDKDEVEVVISH
ncbi:MAG: PrgI family protein [Candidatus Saccharimonadales bacterium]